MSPRIIIGIGAAGSPKIRFNKSGRVQNIEKIKNKKDTLRKDSKSSNENAPKIIDINPNPTKLKTKANWSNIVIASEDGLLPKASEPNINLNSGEKKVANNGSNCIKIQVIAIQKIVLIFIWLIYIIKNIKHQD